MKTMGDRLRAARINAKYSSAAKAAEALGVTPSSYRAHENGQNEFDPEIAEKYARKFGTSAAYLLTGEGPARVGRLAKLVSSFDPDQDDAGTVSDQSGYSREHWRPNIKGAIPEIDSKLGAGSGTVSGEIINIPVGSGAVSGHPVLAEWLLPETFLRHELKVQISQSLIQEVIGDSMVPTYQPGDRVIIDLTQNRLVADTVYAISDGDSEPQIKRLQRVPFSDPVEVLIISDNPALEKFRVELSKLTIIGRVCGVVSKK